MGCDAHLDQTWTTSLNEVQGFSASRPPAASPRVSRYPGLTQSCYGHPGQLGHEATVSKVGESQLFYLMSRGLTEDQATAMIVAGFIEPIVKELPMEYAVEMNRLIEINMAKAGAVG